MKTDSIDIDSAAFIEKSEKYEVKKMKVKKNLKHVFSFLLVVCMVSGLIGAYVPGGVAKAADTPATYTVEWTEQSKLFLGNKDTDYTGPVTLTYTVEETNKTTSDNIGIHGMVATTDPTIDYPHTKGTMWYRVAASNNRIIRSQYTYKLTFSIDQETGKLQTSIGSEGAFYANTTDLYKEAVISTNAQHESLDVRKASKNFGIFIEGSTTAKLVNVTCTDANGKDLGLQSNRACNIQKDVEPMEVTSYTVEWTEQSKLFLGNKDTDYTGPVTLTYTVEETNKTTSDNIGIHGMVATTDPTIDYPHTKGTMWYRVAASNNRIIRSQYTYKLTFSIDQETGKLQTSIGSEGAFYANTTDLYKEAVISTNAQHESLDVRKASKNFGIFIEGSTTAKLVNVTCTDANGKDLGLQSNKTCTITAEQDSKVQEFTSAQYATYRTGGAGNYTAPTAPDGYVFAGWFSDKTCKTALKTDTIASDAVAYAKYVDADILSVKCQIPANAKSTDQTTTLRLVTTVDCLDYSLAGFEVSVAGSASTLYTTRKAYDKIEATVNSTKTTYMPHVFSSESGHFMALEITGVPSEVFNETITVTPAWKTLDGTIVRATENCRSDIKIADAIANLGQ